MEITDKISYALGFLWADGYITKGSNNIGLFLKSDDFNEIKDIIKELIPYQKTIIRYTESDKHKEQTGFNFSNKQITNFLTENDFRDKSVVSADKIIALILKNNVRYFLRGFFDGDGSVNNMRSNVISFTGSINQRWGWLINILKELDIKYNIYKNISNNGSLSRITIYNINNCVRLFEFIYPNKKYDFGLKRKYDSLNEIFFKLNDDYIYKSRRNGITEMKYYFINNQTNVEFSIVGEKKVYEFFKSKNVGLKQKEKYCGQKIIDKENTIQKDITFIQKKRIKAHMGKNKKFDLFLDDIRLPSHTFTYIKNPIYLDSNWDIVRSYDEFVKIIMERGVPDTISFDHDLGPEAYKYQTEIPYDQFTEKTGYHCAKWLIEYCIDNNKDIPQTILIHTMNPVGRQNIESLFRTYEKVYRRT